MEEFEIIVFFVERFSKDDIGGVKSYLRRIIHNFSEKGIKTKIITLKTKIHPLEEENIDGIDVIRLDCGDFLDRVNEFSKIAPEKREEVAKEYFNDHPQLSKELIQALIEKQIHFIGIDCAGIRQHLEHEEADRLCEQGKIYVIENLCNLAKIVVDADFTVYTMWLDDEEMTGLKCRVLIEQ